MTTAHSSSQHLARLPDSLRSLYLPPSTKPERFVTGKPVKGRNEPHAIGGVAWVVNSVQGGSFEELVEQAWTNTVELFGLHELDT